jgi:cytochrome c oxidase assembly protein subunit 19
MHFSHRNLMAPDNFKNLGLIFKEDQEKNEAPATEPPQGTEQKK